MGYNKNQLIELENLANTSECYDEFFENAEPILCELMNEDRFEGELEDYAQEFWSERKMPF